MIVNPRFIAIRTRIFLESAFLLLFFYQLSPLQNNITEFIRISAVTFGIYVLFLRFDFRRDKLNNLFNLHIIFFLALSLTQTIKNIGQGSYVLLHEAIHYILILFILSYNSRKLQYIMTGLVLFIIYSFRIFDKALLGNEFILMHSLSLLLALAWLEELYEKRKVLTGLNFISIPCIAFIIIGMVSTFTAVCPYTSLMQMMVMMNFIFIGCIVAGYIRDMQSIKMIIGALFFLGAILLVMIVNVLLYKFFHGGVYSAFSRLWIDISSPFRIHPNSIAGCFSVLLCLVIGGMRLYKNRIFSIVLRMFIPIMAFILLLTYSRLGNFSFIAAMFIWGVLRYKEVFNFLKQKNKIICFIGTCILGFMFFSPLRQRIWLRICDIHSSNSSFYSCKNSIIALKDRLLLGMGLDNYCIMSKYVKEQISTGYGSMMTTRNLICSASHSLYVGIAFGMGIIGLLIFIWLLISIILYFIRLNRYISYDRYESRLLQGIFVAFVSVIIHGILAMTFHLTILPAFFWILVGLIVAIGNTVGFNKKVNYKARPFTLFSALSSVFLLSIFMVMNPVVAEKNFSIASKSAEEGLWDRSYRAMNRAIRSMPINPMFYERKAEVERRQGLLDEAISSYRQALFLKKDYAFYHRQLGHLYWQKGIDEAAHMEFRKAINLDPFGVCGGEHYSSLGSFYKRRGDQEKALLQFKKAVLITPDVVCNVHWEGKDYIDNIFTAMQQEHELLKETKPQQATQIFYALKHARRCIERQRHESQ